MKKTSIFFIVVIVIIFIYAGNNAQKTVALKTEKIIVHVSGEVKEEKTVTLLNYSTFEDLLAVIELKDTADISMYSLKMRLKDEERIVILKKEEKRISVNTANVDDLILVPGIGEVTARNIIEYRNTYGLFTSLETLKEVKGIGVKKFEKIKLYLCL